jgi:large subunit ribosomal protein L35
VPWAVKQSRSAFGREFPAPDFAPIPAGDVAGRLGGDLALNPRLFSVIRPLALNRPADRAAVAVRAAPSEASTERISSIRTGSEPLRVQESQMPKLKTKSGAKKRFKITGTGKVMYAQAGKRHGMIKRTTKQIRNLRGTTTLFEGDAANVKKYFLPNSR